MSRVDEDNIGARVALLRKQRGISQQRLAADAYLSKSLVSKVEIGQKSATPAFTAAVARALGAEVTQLTGQPYREAREHAEIGRLRRALMAYDMPVEGVAPRAMHEIRADVDHAERLRTSARYIQLSAFLPGLIEEVTTAVNTLEGGKRQQGLWLLPALYQDAIAVTYKLGYVDLSHVSVDRYAWTAAACDDPLLPEVAKYHRAQSCFLTGAHEVGLRLMDDACAAVEPELSRADEPTWAVWGSLHLRSAILAARAGRAQDAWSHIEEARRAGPRAGGDGDYYGTAFGPSNIGVHEVATAAELGDGAEAVKRGERVRLSDKLTTSRRGHHYIDLARGYLWQGNRKRSLECLLTAERLTPDQARNHPMVRETTRTLIRLERQAKDSLRGLANRIGLPD